MQKYNYTTKFNVLILVFSFFFISVLLIIRATPVNARTQPIDNSIPKPDNFLIHLPFAPGQSSDLHYNSYSAPTHMVGEDLLDRYAIDFNLGGHQVYPIAPGKVIFADYQKDYGNVVFIEHTPGFPGFVSLYAHLDSINPSIQVGENVSISSPLGFEGKTGDGSRGIRHLHFAMRFCDNVSIGSIPTNNCHAVVPEPFLGKEVYEGLGWWHDLNPGTPVVAASRPEGDTSPPSGTWNANATSSGGEITYNSPLRFDISYSDAETEVSEIRLTIHYPDWSTNNYFGFNPDNVWRILARCQPEAGGCGQNDWQFEWSPYLDSGYPTTSNGLLEIPWLPKANPPVSNQPVTACISFDLFDSAGNPLYAPAGTQCNSLLSNGPLPNPFIDAVTAPSENEARLIHILPLSEGLPTPDNAVFTNEESPSDFVVVAPGQAVHKSWWMQNTGSTTWESGYQLVFTGGKQMGAPSAVSVPAAAPGEVVELNVDIIAPSEPGTHRGYWRLRNPQGTYFGNELWVQVNVPGNTEPPPGSSDYTLTCLENTCPTTVEPGQSFRPTIRATVGSGQLLESRGDMLRHKSGDLFGAWPQVAVVGTVNQGQAYDFTFYADNPITAPASDGTYQSTWQLWQNGQWVGPEYTIEFTVGNAGGTNYPPNAPTLLEPGDWAASYGDPGYMFSAQHNGDPDGDSVSEYYFELTSASGTISSGWINNSSWTTALAPEGYEWHVKVRDSRGAESDWSAIRHITIYDPNIDITQLEFVPLDSEGEVVRILACADAPATLKVEVNTASDGSNNGDWHVLKELGVPCFNDIDAPVWNTLEYETGPHLVRVLARGDGGWENAAVREATYTVPADHRPDSPTGILPTNDAYVNSQTVTFDWKETLRTDSYRLEASLIDDFSTLLYSQEFPVGTSEHTYTFASDYETVYWRVIATGPYGSNETNRQLHIDLDAPDSAISTLPLIATDTQFTVNWSGSDARSGLRWYHVQVRDGDRPDSEWIDWLANTAKTAEIFQGQTGHTYYFRVRAMDEVGNWELWPGGDGDTYTSIDPSAAPPTAWWDENYSFKRNLVILNNDGDLLPVGYPMHIHFDSTTNPTAAEIYDASIASIKGDDVRIIYENQTELDRFIQNFTSDEIDIWFPLQAALGSTQTDEGSYQIYYSFSNAENPPSDTNAVFLPKADSNTILLAHFQEGSGNVVSDTSGRGHNGTFDGAGWVDGYLGSAGLFNGSTSKVSFGNHTDFNLGAMTLEAWVYVTAQTGAYEHIFDKETYWLRLTGSRKPEFRAFGAVAGWSCPDLSLNTWYHLAATYNGSDRVRVYINGKMCNEGIDSQTPLHTSANFQIGAEHVPAPLFPGYIQHVRVSNIERTSFPYALIDIPPSLAVGAATSQPIEGNIDLILLDLTTFPNSDGGVLVQAVFENQGNKATGNGFYVDLYLDQVPEVGDTSESVLFWVNDAIEAGSTVTVTKVIDSLADLGIAPLRGQGTDDIPETSGTLYAQVDSTGVVAEPDDANNIFSNGVAICLTEADAYEDDNTPEEATDLLSGTVQTHNIHSLSDEDWFTIQMEADETYVLETFDLGPDADTYLYLFDSDGETLLASNDDFNGTLASEIQWTPTASATYYMLVKHWNPNISGCGTSYTILFSLAENDVYLPMVIRQ